MVLIAPSILSADFANLEAEIKKVEEAKADWVHVDVMDGGFVPNITIGAPVVKNIKPITKLFIDVHLMIFQPEKHIPDFVKAGADLITFHMEAYRFASNGKDLAWEVPGGWHSGGQEQEDWEAAGASESDYDMDAIRKTIALIKDLGVKVGISVNPSTPVSVLEPILKDVNMVLLMSVNPGFGGQSFRPVVLDKIKILRAMADSLGITIGLNLETEMAIEVDGGVAPGEVADSLKEAGANVLVAGSAIYGSNDIERTIWELKQ